ncbi:MAG: hypothetical protein JXA50_01610 [Deltaproteobacteria bacterium]|nr:hypothetical protein [Deltaproteobacteria bacterium]
MKMICSQCQTALKPYKNGVTVIETEGTPPKPCRIFEADMWACPVCDIKIVTGFGQPIARSYETTWGRDLKAALSNSMVIYGHQEPVELSVGDLEIDGPRLIRVAQ